MKNLLKNYLFIIAVFFTIVTTAMDDGIDVRVSVSAKTINFTLQNSDGNIEVSIIDCRGFELYKEKFQGAVFAKKFDFATLPKGDYFFEIEGKTKIRVMPFTVEFNHIKINSKPETIFYKPIVRMENDNVFISILAGDNESLEIELFDEASNLLYTEEIVGKVNLGRKLNISRLIKGDYRLVLKSGNKIFKQTIKKKN